ncbi:MAG: MFS transporter [Paracoccaceae bacterium]
MTVGHLEAAPGGILEDEVAAAQIRRPAVFAVLFAPFGISGGYVTVTLAFLLKQAGLPVAIIAGVAALSVLPQTYKMLWAPFVDTIGNPKLWYGLGTVISGACILAMSVLPMTRADIPVFSALILISSVASTFVSMSSEIFMANYVPEAVRGRASGWSQVGNVGGSGIGGGLGLVISQHITMQWISGAVLAAICLACWAGVLLMPSHQRDRTEAGPSGGVAGYSRLLSRVIRDVWQVVRSRLGILALILMVLPIASGAVTFSAIADEWGAGADMVAGVNGLGGGVAAALGALAGGYVYDRLDNKLAYCVFGILVGLVAVGMAYAPRTPTMFAVFVLAYQFMVGGGYAGYVAIILEAIGKKSAATNFNVMAALSNVPIWAMTLFDGWTHDRYGTVGMFWGELLLPVVAIAAFALVVVVTGPRRGA